MTDAKPLRVATPVLLALALAASILAIYAFEIYDFMTRSWNTALYPATPLPDCAVDAFSSDCYGALKRKYLGNLGIADLCLVGLVVELAIVRVALRQRLSDVFGKRLFLAAFITAAVILCLHTVARLASVIIGTANSNSNDGFGIYLGLYVLSIPPLAAAQCFALGAANFPTRGAHKLSAPRCLFMAMSALIPLVHLWLKCPIDDAGLLPWGILTWSAIAGMLRESAAKGD